MTRTMRRVALLSALVALGACSEDDGDPSNGGGGNGGTQEGSASLRVLHLSPDAPEVDVFAGDARLVSGLAFGAGAGPLEVDAGTYDLAVAPAGAGVGSAVLEVPGVALAEDRAYTAVAWNEVGELAALLLEDDRDPPADGLIRLRLVHTAAAIGTVDVWSLSGTPARIVEGLERGAAADPLEIPAGAYQVGVDADRDGAPDVIFDVRELAAGTIASVFAVTDAAGAPFLLAQLDGATTVRIDPAPPVVEKARLRVLHLSPDAPGVDVFLDEGATPAVEDLEYLAGTAFLEVPAGGRAVDVAPAGAGIGAAVLAADVTLDAGAAYTAVAFGALASIDLLALEDDLSTPAAGAMRVRAVHAAGAVGEVDVWNVTDPETPSPLWTDLAFGEAGAYLEIPPAAYVLGVDADGDATPDLLFDLPQLPAGTVASVFAVSDDDGVRLLAQLQDGSLTEIAPRDDPEG